MVNVAENVGSPDDLNTVNVMDVGDVFTGELQTVEDTDWIAIDLIAGVTYTFQQIGGTLSDPYLYLYDSVGGLLASNDDSDGLDSTIVFTAAANGTYFLQADNFIDNGSGSYTVTVTGGPTNGDDVLFGADMPTTLDLLDGDDIWTGVSSGVFAKGQFTDTIFGGRGNDQIYSGWGNDEVDGGQDDDLLDLGDGNDNAWGGEGDDVLFGGTGLDRLNGNSGDDEIYGGKGGDIIQGGKGEDLIYGDNQSDIIYGGAQSDEIYGGTGNDKIFGDEGADLIFGGSGNDEIEGGTFDDIIHGDHGKDIINGGSGDDTLYGGVSDDKLNGNSGDDALYGGRGNDKLTGGTGNDILDGGSQGDRLFGGDGNDILYGSIGNDELTGGADADTFVFAGTVNDDIITDFEVGIDVIDLTGYGPISDADASAIASQSGADVVLNLGQHGSVTLQGIDLGDLSLDDFIYIPEDSFAS